MISEEEVQERLKEAEKEIQNVCSRLGLTIESDHLIVWIQYKDQHENGDYRIRALELQTCPF